MYPLSPDAPLLHPVGGLMPCMPGAWIEPPEPLIPRTVITAVPDLSDIPQNALSTSESSHIIESAQAAAWRHSTAGSNLPMPAASLSLSLEQPESPRLPEGIDSFFSANDPHKPPPLSIENTVRLKPNGFDLSPLSTAMALGDEALLAYSSMLVKSQQLQVLFPPPDRRAGLFVDEDVVDPTSQDELAEELSPENPISGFPRSTMGEYFNAAVDIRNALALRQSIIITDIGNRLGELAVKLGIYDADGAVLAAVDREIELMHEASNNYGLRVNFHGLEYFRSKLEPSRSPSFMEKNNLLCVEIQNYLEAHENSRNAAYQFLDDPSSLREHRLSPFFSSQNALMRAHELTI